MLLPGRLESTTLGDILGQLHRGRASGVLELHEVAAVHRVSLREGLIVTVQTPSLGIRLGDVLRRHYPLGPRTRRALEQPCPRGLRIGQWLLEHAGLRPELLAAALRHQQRERLEVLYRVARAEIRFRAFGLPASPATRLDAREFLHGRPRQRDASRVRRAEASGARSAEASGARSAEASGARSAEAWGARSAEASGARSAEAWGARRADARDSRGEDAWSLLELPRDASREQVHAAFRRLARRLHPDAWVNAPPPLRDRAARRFVRLSTAYHELMRLAG